MESNMIGLVQPPLSESLCMSFYFKNNLPPAPKVCNCKPRSIFIYFLAAWRHWGCQTHSLEAVGTFFVSSDCLWRACSSTAGATPMSKEQRLRWAERLFWDLNFLPQMGQSGTPGGGGGRGAGALSSLSSKHLQKEHHFQSELTLSVIRSRYLSL